MKVEKRINEIVNRLNRTKVERKPDLKGKLHILSLIFIFFVLKIALVTTYKQEVNKSGEKFGNLT